MPTLFDEIVKEDHVPRAESESDVHALTYLMFLPVFPIMLLSWNL